MHFLEVIASVYIKVCKFSIIDIMYTSLAVRSQTLFFTGVIGMRVSPGIVFPGHISLGMHVSLHI